MALPFQPFAMVTNSSNPDPSPPRRRRLTIGKTGAPRETSLSLEPSGALAPYLFDDVLCARPELATAELLESMVDHPSTAAPVVDEKEKLIGIVSRADLLRAVLRGSLDASVERAAFDPTLVAARPDTIEAWMTTRVVSIPADASCQEALRLFDETGVHQIVVVDDEHRPVGLLTSVDAARMGLG